VQRFLIAPIRQTRFAVLASKTQCPSPNKSSGFSCSPFPSPPSPGLLPTKKFSANPPILPAAEPTGPEPLHPQVLLPVHLRILQPLRHDRLLADHPLQTSLPGLARLPPRPLRLVWVANQYMSIYKRLRLDIKHEHIEIKAKEEDVKGRETSAEALADQKNCTTEGPRKRSLIFFQNGLADAGDALKAGQRQISGPDLSFISTAAPLAPPDEEKLRGKLVHGNNAGEGWRTPRHRRHTRPRRSGAHKLKEISSAGSTVLATAERNSKGNQASLRRKAPGSKLRPQGW
jgi:hypothetical protein